MTLENTDCSADATMERLDVTNWATAVGLQEPVLMTSAVFDRYIMDRSAGPGVLIQRFKDILSVLRAALGRCRTPGPGCFAFGFYAKGPDDEATLVMLRAVMDHDGITVALPHEA